MRWVFRIIGALVMVAVLGIAALFLLPTERIAKIATDQLAAATGLQVSLTGEVRPSLWPELGVRTGAVTLGAGAKTTVLEAEGLSIGVDAAALWGGAVTVRRVDLVSPVIRLERAADGSANWELAQAGAAPVSDSTGGAATPAAASGSDSAAAPAPSRTPRQISLDAATISNGRVIYEDRIAGTRIELSQINGSASLGSLDGPLVFDVSAVLRGQALAVEGQIPQLGVFLAGAPTEATLRGTVGGSSFAYSGRAGFAPVQAAGDVTVNLADPAAVFALIGAPAPQVPAGLGQRPKLAGAITYTEAGLALRGATIDLDQNRLSGDVDVALAGRPKVTARLSAGDLDFSALMGPAPAATSGGGGAPAASSGTPAPSAAPAPAASGWSKERIDVSALQAVDADVALAARSIDLGRLKLGAAQLRTTLETGRAVTEIQELAAYGGNFGGSFVLNSRGGLSARANLTASSVAIQPLLTDLAGYDRLIATGDVALNILAIGNDMDTLMRSLDGDFRANFGKGELRGLDLVGMLRNLDPGYVGQGQKTIFNGLSGSGVVRGGVVSNEDLALDASLLTATGRGTVDIGGKSLNYRLRPKLLEGQTGGVAVPLIITGPWAKLKFKLDLEALAKEELADEIEQVKDAVEGAVLKKIEEETGLKAESLGQVEDAAKTALENEVQQRLNKELGDAVGGEVGNALRGLLGR